MTTMILLSAIPGSGKSTWARQYAKAHPNTHIISSDDIRQEFFGRADCFDDEPRVWKTFLDRINSYASSKEDVHVIADATNLTNHYRSYYLNSTPGFDKHVLVLFDIPFEIAEKQNKLRHGERRLNDEAMSKLEREWEQPSEEVKAAYDEVIVVDSSFVSNRI